MENTIIISLCSTNWTSWETDEDPLSIPPRPPQSQKVIWILNFHSHVISWVGTLRKISLKWVCAWFELPVSNKPRNIFNIYVGSVFSFFLLFHKPFINLGFIYPHQSPVTLVRVDETAISLWMMKDLKSLLVLNLVLLLPVIKIWLDG